MHINLSSRANRFLHIVMVRMEVLEGEKNTLRTEELKREIFFYRIALLTPCREENCVSGHLPLLFGSLLLGCVLLHLAPGCVLKVLSKACTSKLHEETKERGNQGRRLRHISSDFSVIHHRLLLPVVL